MIPRRSLVAIILSTFMSYQSPALSATQPNIPPKSSVCPEARITETLGYIKTASEYLAKAVSSYQDTLLRLQENEINDSFLESQTNDVKSLLAQSRQALVYFGQTLRVHPCVSQVIKDKVESFYSSYREGSERYRDIHNKIRDIIRNR